MMKVHMAMQGKGGVGKSLICSLLAQYLKSKNSDVLCIDTDPINATLSGFKSLNVEKLAIMQNDEINTRHFDQMVELIQQSKSDVIIDNGASAFIPLAHYMLENEIPALLKTIGYQLEIHTIITGGQAYIDTCNAFAQLIGQFPEDANFVVWLNPFWGPVEYEGRGFEQLQIYEQNKKWITAIIKLPAFKQETFGQDFTEVLNEKITFYEALHSKSLPIVTLQRLQIIQRDIFKEMDAARIL